MSRSQARPSGRDEVVRALLDAATALFADRGPSGVSVRDVARAAGVNHGLVHRHFGSKEGLVKAVMNELSRELASSGLDGAKLVRATTDSPHWRVLARALLDGADPRSLQDGFPVAGAMLAEANLARRDGRLSADLDPRLVTAMSLALGLGWLVFEAFIVTAAGLERRSRPRLRERALATWIAMLRPST